MATLLLAVVGTARADVPGQHPAYLHALEDLRHARAHLERPTGGPPAQWDERAALIKIDSAMIEIRRAAIDDGKDLKAHPPVDAALDFPGRLRRALELLKKARADVDQDEDNEFARGLKRRALAHIDRAIGLVEEGIAFVGDSAAGKHPAYIRALEDLRHARAHLERQPGGPVAKWDERGAIAKIDDAIREIKAAAIDDGKELSAHPPIDVKLDWTGRMRRTLELLRQAREDVGREEDNPQSKGLQARALAHIDQAIRLTEQGMAAH